MLDPLIPPQPHHLEAERVYLEIARRLTPAQQLATLHGLQQSAWGLKAALLRSERPELSEQAIRELVKNSFLYANP